MIKRDLKYLQSEDGQFAIMLAIIAAFLLFSIGSTLDVARNYSTATKLQHAVDSAATAGASLKFLEEESKDNEIKKRAEEVFDFNCPVDRCKKPDVNIEDSEVTVSYTAEAKNAFLPLLGFEKTNISVAATAEIGSSAGSEYIDVYFLVDASGSMNIADGLSQIQVMQSNFFPYGVTDGCGFACHRTDGTGLAFSGHDVAESLNVYLREDRIRDELDRISDDIIDESEGRARISIVSFGWNSVGLVAQTSLKSGVDAGISNLEFEQTSSQGTNLSVAIPILLGANLIPTQPGDGTAQNPRNIVVMISDGVENADFDGDGVFTDVLSMNPADCDPIKDRVSELFVFNINYPKVEDLIASPASEWRIDALNAIYDELAPNLEACASPGRYFEGDYEEAVTDAFDEIFDSVFEGEESPEVRLIR